VLNALILISRVLLAAVFAVAAFSKLADRAGTRAAVVEFGAPRLLAGPIGLLLPIAELAVAGLLLPDATARAGAFGAIGLLVLFSAAIAVSLARGRTPDCHCFGQLHSSPAGGMTLARNAALAAVAGFVLVGTLTFAIVAAGAALVAAVALAFLELLRSYGRVLVRVERVERALVDAGIDLDVDGLELVQVDPAPEVGLAPGTPAPAPLDDQLARGLPLLLVFTSPGCGPCEALLPRVAEWERDHADRVTVAVSSDDDLYDAFEVRGTPSAVLVAPDGTIDSWVASGADAIEALVDRVVDAPGLPLGAPAPKLELPALDGDRVKLADLEGRDTLLLFWNPDCGFCRSMHDDVLAWEATANGVTPRLVVVSSGNEEATRAEGFRSRVLLDAEFAAGAAFGTGGTPTAVLVGADGRVASGVVAGADAVFALAGDE
jgi:thiol-disulfide isomerase/thioredoxin